VRRRPILIASDLGRAVALASIPTAAYFGALTMYQMYAVALLVGVFTVFFDVSYQSYLPALIERQDLVDGNSKLEISRSTASVAGPGLAGFLIQYAGAAAAIVVDAVSYLGSALLIWLVRSPEPQPSPAREEGAPSGIIAELREGLQVVFGNRILRRIVGCTATSNLGSNITFAVVLIFFYRQLHLSPAEVGIIFGAGSIGGLVGAAVSATLARRINVGPTIIAGCLSFGIAFVALPAALVLPPLPVLTLGFAVATFGTTVYNVTQVSLRQAIAPNRVQGRMNATIRTVVWGTLPLGSVIGGILGTTVGLLPTIYIGGIVGLMSFLWVLGKPVRSLRQQPEPVEPTPTIPDASAGLG
jgi:MFS family permease